MRKHLFLIAAVFGSVLCRLISADLFGTRWAVDCLLITVVFFHLWKGSRSSLAVALLAGWLRDSLNASYGLSTIAFIAVSGAVTVVKMFLYHPGSRMWKMILTACAAGVYQVVYVILLWIVRGRWPAVAMDEVLFTQIILTSLLSPFWMEGLRRCALKFSV